MAYSRSCPVICTAEKRKASRFLETIGDRAPIGVTTLFRAVLRELLTVGRLVNRALVHSAAVHYCAHYRPSSDTTLNHNNPVYKLATYILKSVFNIHHF